MTQSPKKYVSSYTNCTAHRGVEAKETELLHADLDGSASNCSDRRDRSSELEQQRGAGDDTPSYLQVVVEKHRRGRPQCVAAAAQTCPRLPTASSPLHRAQDLLLLPHALLLPHYYAHNAGVNARMLVDTAAGSSPTSRILDSIPIPGGAGDAAKISSNIQKKSRKWKILSDTSNDDLNDNEPECVEVYYFEQGAGAWLATCGTERAAWSERATRRSARTARTLLAELLAVPTLIVAAPLHLLLAVQRCMLLLLRTAITGAVQTTSDYAFKPVLALFYNALLQPLLVFTGNAARGVRAALQPLAAALEDAVKPLVRILSAVRLVEVRSSCPRCACAQHAHHATP